MFLLLYCLAAVIAMGWPWMGAVIAVIVVANLAKRGHRRLTTLGSARWAEEPDLHRAGMLNAQTGLLLGRTKLARSLLPGIGKLFWWRIDAVSACREFWTRFLHRKTSIAQLPNAIHTSVFSPSGGGKGVSCVVPFLLTCDESCVVVDFKGENAKLTADHRRNVLGHQVVIS